MRLRVVKTQAHRKRVPTLLDYLNQGEKRHSLGHKEGTKSEELKVTSALNSRDLCVCSFR